MPFEVGQIASDYEILGLLGKGGMGRVYRVRNVISNRVEAMKVLLADVAAEEELGDRFLGEIRTLAKLDHPNIAKFHTAFKYENQLVMVMEFVEGFTLSDRAKQGLIPLDEVLSYVTQTLAALGYAHQNGVIHRDIKPSNIMITPHGVAKLMDFGIAKSNLDAALTRPGTTMGSMLYMSPEQVNGTTVNASSDLYSVGVLLYELAAGRRPFEAESELAILQSHLNTTPQPPIEVNPALPQPLNEIIMTSLEKEPMRRFQSAEAFCRALESVRGRAPAANAQAAAASPTMPMAMGKPGPPHAKSGARGLWMALGAVACVCVLAAGALTLPHFWKSSAATRSATHQVTTPDQPASTTPAPTPVAQTQPAAQDPSAVAGNPAATPASMPSAITTPAQVRTKSQEHRQVSQDNPRPAVLPAENQPTATSIITPPPPTAQPNSAPPQPSAQDMDTASEDLMKLHARAEAVKDSLDNLRRQQAQDGLGIRQDIASASSRLTMYLGAADNALRGNSLESARKNMERAEQELDKLEKFFGR